jgi:hypothetical protein
VRSVVLMYLVIIGPFDMESGLSLVCLAFNSEH